MGIRSCSCTRKDAICCTARLAITRVDTVPYTSTPVTSYRQISSRRCRQLAGIASAGATTSSSAPERIIRPCRRCTSGMPRSGTRLRHSTALRRRCMRSSARFRRTQQNPQLNPPLRRSPNGDAHEHDGQDLRAVLRPHPRR